MHGFWSPVKAVGKSMCLSEAYFLNYIAAAGNVYSK